MNLTTHLFGDSFLADWTKDKKPFPLCNDYIDWEKTRGNHDIEDIPYWLNKLNHSNVKNYAKGGSSNDSIFESLEENYDLIIIGKKIVKNQIENIKKNILQKKACQLHPIIFESDEIIDDNLVLSINYYDIYLSGKFKMEEIMFKLHGRNWVEIL